MQSRGGPVRYGREVNQCNPLKTRIKVIKSSFRVTCFVTRFRRIRLFLKWCCAGLVGMLLLLLCSDWWLPLVVPRVLKQWNVQVGAITRVEGGRWQCVDVRYESDGVMVLGDVIRMPGARRTLQAYWQGTVADSLLVEVEQLSVVLSATVNTAASDPAMDVVGVLSGVRSALSAYESWIPAVEVEAASILSNEAELLNCKDVSLRGWQLTGVLESRHFAGSPVVVEADLRADELWYAHINAETIGLQGDARVHFEATDRVALQLSLVQGEESLETRAVWLGGESLPSEVQLNSNAFLIQRNWFPGLAAVPIERLRVSDLDVSWRQGRYLGHLALAAELPVEDHEAQPLQALLTVVGDLDVLCIENCEISGAWGQLALSNTLEIDLSEWAVLTGAAMTASLDLAKQSWIPATGHLDGLVTFAPDRVDGWDVRFDLNGQALSYRGYEADGVDLAGEIQGSTITLERLQLDLLDDTEADRVSISGVADWGEGTMDLKYQAALGADWLNARLGEAYFADALAGEGRVFGSFDDPELEGVLEPVTLLHPQLYPVTLAGEVRALSNGAIDVNLSASCEGASVLLDLAASRRDGLYSVEFQQAIISDPQLSTVRLLQPARVTYQADGEVGERWQVDPLHLVSEDGEARLNWKTTEGLSLFIRNMASTRVDRWFKQGFPLHQIDAMDLVLTQFQPNLLGYIEIHAQGQVAQGELLRIDLVSRLESQGISIEQVGVNFDGQSLLAGTLALPIRLQLPTKSVSLLAVIPGGHLSGELTGQTTPAFSQWLADLTEVNIEEASLKLSVSGFWTDPLGTAEVHVAGLDLGSRFAELELPKLTALAMKAQVDAEAWQIEQFECLLNESRVLGAVTLPTDDILKLLDARTGEGLDLQPVLEHLSGRVELSDWKFEDWRHRFPEVMRQSGELNGELVLQPGLDWSGRLVLNDFALRPTQAYSMIDQIGAELELADRVIRVKQASARIGGSPLALAGWIDGTDLSEPLWEVSAVGQRVPLVRTSDLILRSNVDLTLKRLAKEDAPELFGELNFTQSTLLVEFDPLAPSVKSGPSSRPPYFSITAPSISNWKFNVVASGDAFLRVRSPYFRALVSTNLALRGTFIKPELIGGLRVASGDILFPSVKMELDSGEAFIEPMKPHEVQLDFSGIAQVSSYVITMEVSQTLSDPSVSFSSTPTLPNSEIVRLLATGGLSGGQAGAVGVYLGKGLLGVGAGGVDSSLADRLTIDVGEAGGRDGGNTFGVQYRITDSVYLNGGYDIHEAYNLDLIWSIFKR